MGDNANANWAWKNTEIGVGYQAKGVIRQRTAEQPKIKNMSVPAAPTSSSAVTMSTMQPAEQKNEVKKRHRDDSDNSDDDGKKRKKDKESKKSKKEHKNEHHRADTKEKDSFNPLLQCLAERLSNKTRLFTLEN